MSETTYTVTEAAIQRVRDNIERLNRDRNREDWDGGYMCGMRRALAILGLPLAAPVVTPAQPCRHCQGPPETGVCGGINECPAPEAPKMDRTRCVEVKP